VPRSGAFLASLGPVDPWDRGPVRSSLLFLLCFLVSLFRQGTCLTGLNAWVAVASRPAQPVQVPLFSGKKGIGFLRRPVFALPSRFSLTPRGV